MLPYYIGVAISIDVFTEHESTAISVKIDTNTETFNLIAFSDITHRLLSKSSDMLTVRRRRICNGRVENVSVTHPRQSGDPQRPQLSSIQLLRLHA